MSQWGAGLPGGSPAPFRALPPFCTLRPVHAAEARVGDTLTLVGGLWAGAATITYVRAWLRDGVVIPGANGTSYTLLAADASCRVSCRIIASNSAGTAGPVFTDATAPVRLAKAAPVAVVTPVIRGAAMVGRVLGISDGEYLGGPIVKRRFAWLRNGVVITGADVGTRTAEPADEGALLIGRQWVAGPDGVELQIDTVAVGPIAPSGVPQPGVAPTVSSLPALPGGVPQVGLIVTATAGSYAGTAPISVARQWQRRLGAGAWEDIPAAAALAYAPVSGDLGYTLRLREVATNDYGSVTAYSAESAAVEAVVNQYAYTATRDSVTWGASSMNGGGDGTPGPTQGYGSPAYYNSIDGSTGYIGPAASTPASGAIVSINRGVGNQSGSQITARIAAGTTREKAANTFLHYLGNFGADTIASDQTGASVHFAMAQDVLANHVTHGRVAIAGKHADGGVAAPLAAWLLPAEYNQLVQDAYPSMHVNTDIALRQLPALTPNDETSRDWLDRAMESYWGDSTTKGDGGTDASHLGPTGQTWLARTCVSPFFEAFDGGMPFVGHQRVRSTAATNQTIGGLVASLPAVGAMAGTTWSIVDNTDFSAVVNGQNVELRRASAVVLRDAPYRLKLRATKSGRSRDTYLEVYLCSPAGARQGAVRIAGHHGSGKILTPAYLRNATGQQLSIAIGIQPIAGDGAVRRIWTWGYNNSTYRGVQLSLGNNNQISLYLYNAAGTTVARLESGAATAKKLTAVNGKRVVFLTVDLVAGTWQIYLDGDGTGHTAPTAPVVGETFTLAPDVDASYFHQFFGGNTAARDAVTDYELLALWTTAIDWSVAANRDRVFNASKETVLHNTIGSDAPWTIGGSKALVALQGCAADMHQLINQADASRRSLGIMASRWATRMVTV